MGCRFDTTEFVDEDKKLKKIIADTIITIDNRFSYHLERHRLIMTMR